MFADIIIDITHEKLDKVFQYRIPPELEGVLQVGMEVIVPFGKGNKETHGYVIGFSEKADYDLAKIKEVLCIEENHQEIESKLIALAAWIREYYGGTMIQALKTVLPIKKKERIQHKRKVKLLLNEEEGKKQLDIYLHKNQKARARLLAGLLDQPQQDYELITKKLNVTLSVIRSLEEQGVLEIQEEENFRNPIHYQKKDFGPLTHTPEQQQAIDTFWKDYSQRHYGTYLLYGVTGSGKTEVYIEMISRVVSQGKQAIMLIPEIALTYQTVMRFYARFGNRVSILNSRLSQGERYDQFKRAKRGEIQVMVGPRSALFTPFSDLGLIVIDEEHEPTYKSENTPRYHARETAIERARMEHARVVMGSATPSLEAYSHACDGEYLLVKLNARYEERPLPQVSIVDLREELKKGNRSVLSLELKRDLEQVLERREQAMLFLNRRGYAGFVSCRACGHVMKCPHCDVSLSEHNGNRLICHYCGYETVKPEICPSCGSPHIGGFKAGTQQIEKVIEKEFPKARVLRMDFDTTRTKDSYEKILASFAKHEADILVGTQMIVKGHDFPRVTLVGVMAADLSLYAPDFRSSERTFELLTQASGRAGRGELPGDVVIQTYAPDHFAITAAAEQDYGQFYRQEFLYRKMMGYPPAAGLLSIQLSSRKEEAAAAAMEDLQKWIRREFCFEEISVIGPVNGSPYKVNDIYRKILYIKSESYDILLKVRNCARKRENIPDLFRNVFVQYDLT